MGLGGQLGVGGLAVAVAQIRHPRLGAIKSGTGTGYAAYFGDLKANVYAVDAETGTLIWTQKADPHPLARITGAPALANGRLYVPVSSLEEGMGRDHFDVGHIAFGRSR